MARKLINLKDSNDILIPKVFPTIDQDNLIATINNGSNVTYTAIQECYAVILLYSSRNITINGIEIGGTGSGNSEYKLIIKLKEGDVLGLPYIEHQGKVFGIKY